MESRCNDPTPVRCQDCGWTGKAMDCIHTYKAVPMSTEGDVEPVDQCPKCNSDNLIPIEEELVPA